MTYPPYIREKALELRRQGMTLDEIAERLALPRTTVFHWIKDVPIPPRPRTEAARRAGQVTEQKYRLLREAAYAQGRAQFDALAAEPTFTDFVCMYIAEGSKRNRNAVAIANSDPLVILLGDHWIRRLSSRPVRYWLQYHADQDLNGIRRFWGERLGVASDDIALQRKSNSGRLAGRTWRSEQGVLTVRTTDTYLRARLQAWIDCVKERWLDSIPDGV